MKKTGIVLLIIIVVISCKTSFPVTTEQLHINGSPANIEQGRALTLSACGPCHLNGSTNTLIGERMYDMRRVLGKIYAHNITQDSIHGVGNYSDADLAYLIRTGITNKGKYIPFMLRPNIADEDLNDIIAFLRSDNEEVQPKDTTVGKTSYSLIGKLGFAVINNKPLPYRTAISKPAQNDRIKTGKYLVDILGCFHCHSSNLARINYLEPEKTKGYMQGGFKMRGLDGEKFKASNLTSDSTTGIGAYSSSEFLHAVKTGIAKHDRVLRYPMRIYSDLPDEQVEAIYAYLRTLKPVHNKTRN